MQYRIMKYNSKNETLVHAPTVPDKLEIQTLLKICEVLNYELRESYKFDQEYVVAPCIPRNTIINLID